MRHPVHDLLIRWLGTEQYAFDGASKDFWPLGSWPQVGADGGGDFGEASEAREPSSRDTE